MNFASVDSPGQDVYHQVPRGLLESNCIIDSKHNKFCHKPLLVIFVLVVRIEANKPNESS
jgi:hypothetical protein